MNYIFVPELQKLDKTERLVYGKTEIGYAPCLS
jgi:hypothetical protein